MFKYSKPNPEKKQGGAHHILSFSCVGFSVDATFKILFWLFSYNNDVLP